MGALLKIIVFLSAGSLLLNVAEGCCCSHWLPYFWCGCNIFGCNCEWEGDSEYCYYVENAFAECFKSDEKTCARFRSLSQVRCNLI